MESIFAATDIIINASQQIMNINIWAEEFQYQLDTNFSILRAVPSTAVRQSLAYYIDLKESDKIIFRQMARFRASEYGARPVVEFKSIREKELWEDYLRNRGAYDVNKITGKKASKASIIRNVREQIGHIGLSAQSLFIDKDQHVYDISDSSSKGILTLSFGGQSFQMSYSVRKNLQETPISYENALCFGNARWDLICEGNELSALETLGVVVTRCLRIL